MSELLPYAIVVLIPFAVQLVILFATGKRFRPLRFAIPVLAAAAGAVFFLAGILTSNGLWFPWLYLLGIVLVLLVLIPLGVGLALIGWGLAWLVYDLIELVKRKRAPGPR